MRKAPSLLLSGLDGSNPLGFLAAVGVLRTATLADSALDWRLDWVMPNGTWLPELSCRKAMAADELIKLLVVGLRRDSTPEFDFALNLSVAPETFRNVTREAQRQASPGNRLYADFVASFGCEILVTRQNIQNTAFRTMSGTGHQHFLGTMKQLVGKTESGHLHRSLFESWDYSDKKLGLRWDAEEDRRYALRWANPSGDVTRTVRGANRLAIEALPLFPAVPVTRHLKTTGFSQKNKVVLFTWPIWLGSLSLEVVRSLLSLSELQVPEPDRTKLQAMGVIEVYRSQRINIDRYRNFTRGRPV